MTRGDDGTLALRGALVIDGTGTPGQVTDVLVKQGRIVEVGDLDSRAESEVRLDGLVLAPGFIDIHTHYDAQVLWDQDLTPSSWHAITTVVLGNCGFGLAPTRPEHRSLVPRILENVEGMSWDALSAGITWNFETFPEYLQSIADRPLRLNVGVLVGHTPLRLYVLGDEADQRAATDSEISQIRRLLIEALEAGALGFATSTQPSHTGFEGRPVPSRCADDTELRELASALREANRGVFQIAIDAPASDAGLARVTALARESGRPTIWASLLTMAGTGDYWAEILGAHERGEFPDNVWPQVSCRPTVVQITLQRPFGFERFPTFQEILSVPTAMRYTVYADPRWRARARTEVMPDEKWSHRWAGTIVSESEVHHDLVGRSLHALAQERETTPFDVLVDLSLQEDLRTRFTWPAANDDEEGVSQLLQSDRTVLGLSDAGAHASQLCDACFSTYLLEHWVRERQDLSLEKAVWRLTGQPAQILNIPDRGTIKPGNVADLVAFDPDRVATKPAERVWDLPGGADRLVIRSQGIEHVWISGSPTVTDGELVSQAYPGQLIRGRASRSI